MSEETKTEEQELEELEAEILAAANAEAETEEVTEEAEEVVEQEEETTNEEEDETKPENEGDPEPEAKTEEEEERPDNSAFARQRHELKKLKQELAEARKQPDPNGETVDSSMEKLVKVWEDGTGDEHALLANIRKADSSELAAIYQKALDGNYKDFGEDVIKTVTEAMPMAKAREDRQIEQRRAQNESIKKALEDEASMAKSDFPEFAEDESDGGKFLSEFVSDMAGTLDLKTGELDGKGQLPEELALYLHTHPYVAHQFASKVFKARNSDPSRGEVAKLNKELSTIKERLAKYESIETPSSSGKTGDDDYSDDLEALEKQILAAAGG